MIRAFFKLLWAGIVVGIIVYLAFFVKLGEKTAFEHAARIWKTDEAKELREEVGEASRRLGEEIQDQIKSAQAEDTE